MLAVPRSRRPPGRGARAAGGGGARPLSSRSKHPPAGFHRGAITAFIERHRFAWELAMGLLALVYLGTSFLADEEQGFFPWIILGLAILFLTEFTVRFLDSPSRLTYLRDHWLDLISSIPLVGGLRGLRLLRLLRLGGVVRVLTAAERVAETRGHDRQSLWFVAPSLLVLWFGAAATYWVLEHGANTGLHTFGDALYWAFITTTTVGYGGISTVTSAGHVLAGALIFLGIGLVGFASAQLTQRWLRDESRHHPRLLMEKMNHLDREIASLRELLLEQREAEHSEPPARGRGTRPEAAAGKARGARGT